MHHTHVHGQQRHGMRGRRVRSLSKCKGPRPPSARAAPVPLTRPPPRSRTLPDRLQHRRKLRDLRCHGPRRRRTVRQGEHLPQKRQGGSARARRQDQGRPLPVRHTGQRCVHAPLSRPLPARRRAGSTGSPPRRGGGEGGPS
jgi:hypothetical protein